MRKGQRMNKRRYKQGQNRQQGMLMPPRVEEYVTEENPVRAIDAYVDSLDIAALGFGHTCGGLSPGQPAYPPGMLVKLYLYGYLNHIRSSRKLEKETQRNLEVIWLMEGLRPSYKTIADFRKDNLEALKGVNKDFLQVCKELGLFGGELVGIDGSFFHGNVNRRNIYTEKQLQKALEKLEKQIENYLEEMDRADEEEDSVEVDGKSMKEKLTALKERQQKHKERLKKLRESGEKQLAEVDEEARLLFKNGKSVAGYNVQIAVDEKHKLLIACEVTNEGNDLKQLAPMAKQAKQVLGVETLKAVADTGYFNGQHFKACIEAGITPYVPEQDSQKRMLRQGRFSRRDFHYNAELDGYECPAGQLLGRSGSYVNKSGKLMLRYRCKTPICAQCEYKARCLSKKVPFRQIDRWEHEEIVEAHRERMCQQGGEKMRQRAVLVEHPFATLKLDGGHSHFLLRGKEKVSTEAALLMLSYNLKRVLNILGVETFRTYCLQRAKKRSEEVKKTNLGDRKDVFLYFFSGCTEPLFQKTDACYTHLSLNLDFGVFSKSFLSQSPSQE